MAANALLFIILISLSAFFSASETALFSLGSLRLRRLQEKYSKAKIIKDLLKRPTNLLSTIVFGNMLVNIALSSLFTVFFVKGFGEEGLIAAIFLSGLIVLFLGEIFPKTFAIYLPDRFSLFFSPLLNIFARLFLPIIVLIERAVEFLSKFFIRQAKKSGLSEEELKTAVLLSRKGGYISAEEEEMISYVLEFKDTHASEILTARVDIEGIDTEMKQAEVIGLLREKRHSKLPVYKNSLDNVIGIIYTKDVFLNLDKDYHTLIQKPLFIPESKRIDDLLKLFLEKNERIAVVLDEYGGTSGIVTLEDIEEEIFGEIYDEFEVPKKAIEKIDEHSFRVYGKTPIKTVNIELGLNLPEEEDTLAGLLLSRLERIPRAQEKVIFPPQEGGFTTKTIEFTIERATAKRIVSIILTIKWQEAEG